MSYDSLDSTISIWFYTEFDHYNTLAQVLLLIDIAWQAPVSSFHIKWLDASLSVWFNGRGWNLSKILWGNILRSRPFPHKSGLMIATRNEPGSIIRFWCQSAQPMLVFTFLKLWRFCHFLFRESAILSRGCVWMLNMEVATTIFQCTLFGVIIVMILIILKERKKNKK